MNRGSVIALSFALAFVFAPSARAQDKVPADWKWDAKKWMEAQTQDKTLKVGDKHYHEGTQKETNDRRAVRSGRTHAQNGAVDITYRYVSEILGVDDKGVANKAKVTVEKWSSKRVGGDGTIEDTTLEGRVLLVQRDEENTTFLFQEKNGDAAKGTSNDAKAWAGSEISLNKPFAGALPDGYEFLSEVILPEAPVAPDTEWNLDVQKLAEGIYGEGTKIDREKSKATGRLSNVRMENGYPRGTLRVEFRLQLKDIPGDEGKWTEGGVAALNLEYDGSLVDNRHHRALKVDFQLAGKGEVARDGVKASLDVKDTDVREQKSGRLDK
jgi:hypothetical protein